MPYEIYLLPAAAEADIEEAGEALLARIERFDESPSALTAVPELGPLAAAVRCVDAALSPAPQALESSHPARPLAVVLLRDGAGLDLTLSRMFVRMRIPFDHRGESARCVFERAFRILAAAAAQTGWRAYDPQDPGVVALDDDGRDGALLIYLTAMDQLRPPEGAKR